MTPDDRQKASFQFAQESTKQILSLSTAVVALEITFAKDWLHQFDGIVRSLITASWLAFFIAIVFGVWALLGMTRTLGAVDSRAATIYAPGVRLPAALQVICFVAGMGLTVAVGILAAESAVMPCKFDARAGAELGSELHEFFERQSRSAPRSMPQVFRAFRVGKLRMAAMGTSPRAARAVRL